MRSAGADYPTRFGLVLDPATRRPSPGVLVGGSPLRVLRLGERGRQFLDIWLAGSPVGPDPGARRLARRLVDCGVAQPVPAPYADGPLEEVTVVVPVRDRPDGLARTLDAVSGLRILVVDDGSLDPVQADGVEVVRRAFPGGPAAARNTGWRAASTPLVVFLDADCVPGAGWLPRLLAHFADEKVGAAAARVVSPGGPGALSRYETLMSPLDLGPCSGRVRAATRIPYVPTACLAARRSALDAVSGFDEHLRFGEDVDLVWRLDACGWSVRYEPRSVVEHPPRPGLRPWMRQRFDYGRSAASLASKHGADVAPGRVSGAGAAVWVLATGGHVAAATALSGVASAMVAHSAGGDGPTRRVLLAAAAKSNFLAARSIAEAFRRAWSVPLLVSLLAPSAAVRRRVAAWLGVAFAWPVGDWFARSLSRGERPPLGPLTWTALRWADDLAYQCGVWTGVLEKRSLRAVMPVWTGSGAGSRRGD